MIRFLQRVSVLAVLVVAFSAIVPAQGSSLRTGFEKPPQSAKLRCYWWWLNGNTTEAAITRDLTAMKAKGYGGAILVDANGSNQGGNRGISAGPLFGSPQWVKLYLHALEVAKSLGLEISLNAGSGWNLGGPEVTPQDAAKVLTFSRQIVGGGKTNTLQLTMPPVKNGFYRQIAVLAYPLLHGDALPGDAGSRRRAILDLKYKTAFKSTGMSMPSSSRMLRRLPAIAGEEDTHSAQVIDLSSHTTQSGALQWDFPAGTWEVLRIGYTNSGAQVSTSSGAWQGLMMDYMSRTAFDHYWNRVVAPLLVDAKPYIGTSLRYLVEDSWEATGGENWTDGFRSDFIRRRGYDPLRYLPAVAGRIVDDRQTTNRFLFDLRRTIADLVAANHYDYFSERAARYGLGTHYEAGGPHGVPIDALENFRNSSFPQTEFWAMSVRHRVTPEERFFVKEASSAANIYGKPYVAAEGFTSMGWPWSESPGLNLKPTFDQALTEGLNRLFWHEFTSEPKAAGLPGQEYFAGTHLNPNTTWWKQAGPMLLAIDRAQFLMQQGHSVSDLLYFRGNQVPGFVRLKADDPAHVLPGYNYDVTSEDALLHRILSSHGGLATREGLRYRALALPHTGMLSLASLNWIEKYVREGGLLIGPRPQAALGMQTPNEEKEYAAIAARMWGGCGQHIVASYGSGRIYCTLDAHAALASFGVPPDFEYRDVRQPDTDPTQFDYVHRATPNADIYFVRNTENRPVQAILSFRIHGRIPELWQMDTGATVAAAVYRETHGRTEVPLSFPSYGSIFIIFEHAPRTHTVRIERDGATIYPSILPGSGVAMDDHGTLDTAEPGSYEVSLSDGSSQHFVIFPKVQFATFGEKWTLAFPSGWGAPASIHLNQFNSWTESKNPEIRYFSGTATYRGSLRVPSLSLSSRQQTWIDLGNVREIATVVINGKSVATLWHPPFRTRIDPALHSGLNAIEIRVSNLWANRLIGDSQPGAKRYATTNITEYKSDSPLIPSGLLTRPSAYPVYLLSPGLNTGAK